MQNFKQIFLDPR
jgi:hypothetical protein